MYEKMDDGVILCKMINLAAPDTIDERVLNRGKNISIFKVTEFNKGLNNIFRFRTHNFLLQKVYVAMLSRIMVTYVESFHVKKIKHFLFLKHFIEKYIWIYI